VADIGEPVREIVVVPSEEPLPLELPDEVPVAVPDEEPQPA
jgi:hypothetical protein